MHNALGGGRARRLAVEDPSRGLMPWVGVAAPLVQGPAPSPPPVLEDASAVTSSDHADVLAMVLSSSSPDTAANGAPGAGMPSGRAFCFLPLPIYTGMPTRVHINGYFELSSNRRDIWCEACSEDP